MKVEDLDRKPRVTPFSNGTEAMSWECSNCGSCKKKNNDSGWSFIEDIKMANAGKTCRWEIYIAYGWLDGSVAEYAASKIGWTEKSGWPNTCIMFTPSDGPPGPPRPKRDKPVGPNQMKLFTEFDHLTQERKKVYEPIRRS